MARIRTIKPEYWTSEQVMECSPLARLLFIGLWNFCDDAGRMAMSPKRIKAQVFPSDDITSSDVLGLLQELSANELIRFYIVDGKEFLLVTGWRHQRIDKPQKPQTPEPPDPHSPNDPGSFDVGREKEGKRIGDSPAAAAHPRASASTCPRATRRAGPKPPQAPRRVRRRTPPRRRRGTAAKTSIGLSGAAARFCPGTGFRIPSSGRWRGSRRTVLPWKPRSSRRCSTSPQAAGCRSGRGRCWPTSSPNASPPSARRVPHRVSRRFRPNARMRRISSTSASAGVIPKRSCERCSTGSGAILAPGSRACSAHRRASPDAESRRGC